MTIKCLEVINGQEFSYTKQFIEAAAALYPYNDITDNMTDAQRKISKLAKIDVKGIKPKRVHKNQQFAEMVNVVEDEIVYIVYDFKKRRYTGFYYYVGKTKTVVRWKPRKTVEP